MNYQYQLELAVGHYDPSPEQMFEPIAKGANVHDINEGGWNLLMQAAYRGFTEKAKILI